MPRSAPSAKSARPTPSSPKPPASGPLVPRQRLQRILAGQPIDRPAVICPGGALSLMTRELLAAEGVSLAAIPRSAELAAPLAWRAAALGGFEAIGLPLFPHAEAEALGSLISWQDADQGPRLMREASESVTGLQLPSAAGLLRTGRIATTLQALRLLRERPLDLPLLGNLTGPMALLASLVSAPALAMDFAHNRGLIHRTLERLTELLVEVGTALLASGAEVLVVHEGTGPIADPAGALFEEYAVLYVNRVLDQLRLRGAALMLHLDDAGTGAARRRPWLQGEPMAKVPAALAPPIKSPYVLPRSGLRPAQVRESLPAEFPEKIREIATRRTQGVLAIDGAVDYATPLAHLRAWAAALKQPAGG